jgi:proteasome lid subunit RPN8/RPN11
MLVIPQSVYRRLRLHGEAAYPDECCGVLVGTASGESRTVIETVAMANISASPRNHYEINPREMVRFLCDAQAPGKEVLGFYHSHPDHPAHWSSTDLAEAHWLGCCYVITSIGKGIAGATKAFHLAGVTEEDKHFEIEPIQISA